MARRWVRRRILPSDAIATGYGAPPHVNVPGRAGRYAIASHATGLCQRLPLGVAPAGAGGPSCGPRAGYVMTGPSIACLPDSGCSGGAHTSGFRKIREKGAKRFPGSCEIERSRPAPRESDPAFHVFEKNGCLASAARQAVGVHRGAVVNPRTPQGPSTPSGCGRVGCPRRALLPKVPAQPAGGARWCRTPPRGSSGGAKRRLDLSIGHISTVEGPGA